jgi:rod shape-determining protein MreC
MAVLDIRQRTGWLFFAVTVGHLVLISTQVNTRRGMPLFEAVTFGAFAEVQRAASSAVGSVQEGWENYFALQQIRRENAFLKQQVAQLQINLQQERAVAEQSRTLQRLLDVRAQTTLNVTGATVIGGAASPEFRTVTLDKGSRDGLKRDMAVISPEGVVGRVVLPSARAAKVQLLVDRNAAAAALIERTRAQGVVIGTGTDRLQLEYLPGSADVKPGDQVVTAGIDGIYPKGFVIGQVESVKRGAGDFSVVIKPAADFASLESVLVVLTPPPPVAPDTPSQPAAAQNSSAPAPSPTQTGTKSVPAPPPAAPGATANPAEPHERTED